MSGGGGGGDAVTAGAGGGGAWRRGDTPGSQRHNSICSSGGEEAGSGCESGGGGGGKSGGTAACPGGADWTQGCKGFPSDRVPPTVSLFPYALGSRKMFPIHPVASSLVFAVMFTLLCAGSAFLQPTRFYNSVVVINSWLNLTRLSLISMDRVTLVHPKGQLFSVNGFWG